MNWDDYRFFLAVSRHRTLKAAGHALGVDQATVGRRLGALEKRLRAKLLEKRSDGYFLTALGGRILENVALVENAMFAVDQSILGRDEKVEGAVRLALPAALASHRILPRSRAFFEKHPKLELQFLTGPEVLNLSRREADLAIRLVRPERGELKTKRVGKLRLALYGAKELSAARPAGEKPFVGLFETATSDLEKEFLSALGFRPRYRLRTSSWDAVRAGVEAGLGLGILPDFMVPAGAPLAEVESHGKEAPLWLVVHPEVAKSARVRAVIEHLEKIL